MLVLLLLYKIIYFKFKSVWTAHWCWCMYLQSK